MSSQAHGAKVAEVLRSGLPPKVTLLDACAVDSMTATVCETARSIAVPLGRAGEPPASSPPTVTAPVLLVRYKLDFQGDDPGRVVPRLNEAVFSSGDPN